MDVGLYARVSTDEQRTIEDQISELNDYCKLYGHTVVAEYRDKESGTTTNRKDFQRMLKDVKEKRIEGVVVWKFDRLSRSLTDLIATVNFFKEHNVELMSKHELVDTSKPEGKLLFNILGSIAEFEIDTIRRRTELGLKRAKREGKLCHRPRKEIDIENVKKGIAGGFTLEQIARMQKMTYVTLKKRLGESGLHIGRKVNENATKDK